MRTQSTEINGVPFSVSRRPEWSRQSKTAKPYEDDDTTNLRNVGKNIRPHIPDEMNSQQNRWEALKSHIPGRRFVFE